MKSSSFLLLLVAATAQFGHASLFHQRQSNWTVGQTVSTSSGPVSGHAATNDSAVSEYLGIPFGSIPVRFGAPVNFTGTAPISGKSFGASCPVQGGNNSSGIPSLHDIEAANVTLAGVETLELLSNNNATYSEDCLFLNVWTKPQTGDAKKAVLVWIYGGGFNSGSSTVKGYNGANLANEQDVVVVSFNYRLSVLGFPAGPNTTLNAALLDQRLAVEWVRDNIAKFGGDPSRITLFGQSAGSVSVDLYSYAWKSDPIAAGFIEESGTAFSFALPHPATFTENAWYNLSSIVGCGDASSDPATVLTCMRGQNYQSLLNAIPDAPDSDPQPAILGYFGPTVDGTVVFSNYSQQTPADVPLLIGNNNYEGGLFRTEFALKGVFFSDLFWNDFNLQEFTCPAGIRANASLAAKAPTWRYRYFGIWPDLEVSSEAGAWHASELPILFNTEPANPAVTTQEIAFGQYMRGAWSTFAKNPASGLSSYGGNWPMYDPTADTLVRLAYNDTTGTNLASPYMYDALCVYANVSSTSTTPFTVPNTTTTGGGSTSGSPSSSTTGTSTSPTGTPHSAALRTFAMDGGVLTLVVGLALALCV